MFHHDRPLDNDFIEVRSLLFTFTDIHNVVNAFYKEVAKDPMLRVPFGSVEDWPHHIERLTHFWWTRFGGMAYMEGFYNPVQKHYESGFNQEFLKRWLELFRETLFKHLNNNQAELWASVTESMGMALSKNNEMMINHMGPFKK